MELASILLVIVAVLTILSGVAIFAGSREGERKHGLLFLLITLGAAIWTLAIGTFISLPTGADTLARWCIYGTYFGPLLMDTAFVAYAGWKYKFGKVLTCLFLVISIAVVAMIACQPHLLYSGVILGGPDGNVVLLKDEWFYHFYIVLVAVLSTVICATILYRILHTRNKNEKAGLKFYLIGLLIVAVLALIFDLILPLTRYDLIWVGPLATALFLIGMYYAVLRYRTVVLRTAWLKALTYVILMATGAIAYMVIFFLVFTAMFRIASPSTEVLTLNFIMVIILLLLVPAISEVSAFARSLISVQQVDLAYIVKKLNRLAPQDVDLRELASFLADHLHFEYVGFLINGRLYGSGSLPLSVDEMKQISLLRPAKDGSVWQDFNEPVAKIAAAQKLNAVAELRDAKGKVFGQLIVGEPLGKARFERKDLIQIEMVINLVAVVIDDEKYHKGK